MAWRSEDPRSGVCGRSAAAATCEPATAKLRSSFLAFIVFDLLRAQRRALRRHRANHPCDAAKAICKAQAEIAHGPLLYSATISAAARRPAASGLSAIAPKLSTRPA